MNDSKVTAQATQGLGGNITINTHAFLHDAADVNDVLNASSQVTGNSGTVQDNAPTTDLHGSLTVLPTTYLDAAAQLTPRCGAGNLDSRSRFTVRERGALPLAPDEVLPAPARQCQLSSVAPLTATKPLEAGHTAAAGPLLTSFRDR